MKNHSKPLQTLKPLLAALLMAFPPLLVTAAGQAIPGGAIPGQAIPGGAIPGAGTLLQQVQPAMPSLPPPTGPALTIKQMDDANLAPGTPFKVSAIRISGNTLFDTATLHALVADAEGQTLTLSRLNELVARISAYYHSKDYPLARAIIPAQRMVSGVVNVEIIEARYGKVELANGSRVNDRLLLATLAPLQGRQVIQQTELDHILLLMSDIPGVAVSSTLRPGLAIGSSDMLVNASQSGPAVVGNVTLDNDGNRYTGRLRVGGSVNVIDPLHHGDILSANLLSSGSGLNYGRLAYDTLLNGKGTRVGGSWSALRYALGEPLAALGAHGTAQVASLWVRHTLVRTQNVNLYGQIQFDQLQLHDHIDTSAMRTDRHLDNWTMSVLGDERDAFMAGGVTTWNVGASAGRVGFDDGPAQLADAATAQTRGAFSKWNANVIRLQGLSARNTLYLAFTSQGASGNLDSSQKISAGGSYTVRAYDVALVSGDTGYVGTAELRHDLGLAWNGQWQAVAFVDGAHVTVNKSVWVAGAKHATLKGAGVGLNWTGAQQWSARISIATPLGTRPAQAADGASVRAWGEISRGF